MDEFVKQVQVAYRQMIPYKSLFEHCKNLSQKLDSPWTCLDCQERIYQNVKKIFIIFIIIIICQHKLYYLLILIYLFLI